MADAGYPKPRSPETETRRTAAGAPAAPIPPLSRNLLYALAGNGTLNLCRLGVYALLAKFATADILGLFDFAATAVAAPVVLLLGFEARAAFVADARGEFAFGAYRRLRHIGLLIAAAILIIAIPALVTCVPWISTAIYHPALAWMMFGVCAGRIAFHLAEIEWGMYQRRERLDLLSASNILRGLVMIAPFALLIPAARYVGADAESLGARLAIAAAIATGIYAVGWFFVWRWFDLPNARRITKDQRAWTWSDVRRLAIQTFPLGLVMLLITLCDAVPRWVILASDAGGSAKAGYFGALKVIALGATFLIVQLGNAAGNRLAVRYQTDRPAFLRLAAKLTGVAVALGAGLLLTAWLIGRPLLRIVYAREYAEHSPEFLILMVGQSILLVGAIFGFITTHMRQFWIQVPVQLAVLAATTIAALLLIPDEPVAGAAWTSVVRSVVLTVLYLACVLIGLRRGRTGDASGTRAGPDSDSA